MLVGPSTPDPPSATAMSSLFARLLAFLWEQKLAIAITFSILAAVAAAMLLFGDPLDTSTWSYSFF
jgi:hypothetical protein